MFINMPPQDRRRATLKLANWKRSINAWDRQARDLPNYTQTGGYYLQDYLNYSSDELDAYVSYDQFAQSVDYRRSLAKMRAQEQRNRFRMNRPGQRMGLKEGQYIYFAVAYNHGLGAEFVGYTTNTPPVPEATRIEDWWL